MNGAAANESPASRKERLYPAAANEKPPFRKRGVGGITPHAPFRDGSSLRYPRQTHPAETRAFCAGGYSLWY